MPGPTEEDLEAFRLNLAQVASAPDTWRARAVAAGGFLGAAAAVSLWGLSQQAANFSGILISVAAGAASCYVIAVIGFLVASVLPTPQPDANTFGSLADQLYAFAQKETRPIKFCVLVSAGFGSLAIVLTTLGSFLVFTVTPEQDAVVSISDEDQWTAIERLCPGLQNPFRASVSTDGPDFFRVQVNSSQCGTDHPELLIRQAEMIRLKTDVK